MTGDIRISCLLLFTLMVVTSWCLADDTTTLQPTTPEIVFPKEACEKALPGCMCYDYEYVTGISCQNVSDFSAFCGLLTDGELFEINSTYELEVGGVRSLPPHFLKGLIVFRVFVDDPRTENVDENAFEGVVRLRRFHVRLSSLRAIPNFRPIRNSLRNINLENSLLTSLEGTHLQDLPLIESLSFVNNSIRTVAPDAFKGTDGVIIFDISYNLLESLPPHLFDPWKKIKKLVLSYNNLLHVDLLFAVARPQFIYLDSNKLTDLDSMFHPNMTEVETIQLSNNPLKKVSSSSFNGKINSTRFLYMDRCGIRDFDATHYRDFPILATLDLSYNEIESVTNQTISFGNNLELNFMANKIREFTAELPYNVKRVYLSGNLLTSLGRTMQFSQMSEVSMADNLIDALGPEDFRGVHGVQMLDLQGNRIASVQQDTFLGIRKDLIYLDLSRNRIVALAGCVRYLSLLTSLNLTDNRITSFQEGEFTGLNELSELYLSNNFITQLGGELQRLPQLQYLIISHNRITTLSRSQIPHKLKFFYLNDNPLACDCKIYPFLQFLSSTPTLMTDVPLCIPNNASERSGSTLCPEECACACAADGADHFISVSCSSAGLTELPPLFRINNETDSPGYSNDLKVAIFPSRSPGGATLYSEGGPFMIEDDVRGLDLSNNSLVSLGQDARLPSRLLHLFLRGNLLQKPLDGLLRSSDGLRLVSLSDNPWKCDCGTLGFKKCLLSKSDIIMDVNNTRCGPDQLDSPKLHDRLISSLLDTDLCPTDIALAVSVAFGVLSFFLLIAGMKIAWTKYEMNVKVWLYSKGVTWVKEKDIDRDKQFDAFLSFSHLDEQFVIRELIRQIEERAPNVRLCLHYKHFLAGEFIHDNIALAVENSKRTVLILSKNFLNSEWCMMELRAAHVQALKDRVHRIVVIKLEDLPEDLDPTLKLYLDSTTYLTWGEKYFWQSLLFILPTSGRHRDHLGRDNLGSDIQLPPLPANSDACLLD